MTATQPAPDSLGEVIKTLTELDAKATPAPWRQFPLNIDSFIIGSLENVTVVNRLNNHDAALIVALHELSLPALRSASRWQAAKRDRERADQAEARLAEAEAVIRTIAGLQQPIDNLMSHADLARAYLASLHPQAPEDRKGEETT